MTHFLSTDPEGVPLFLLSRTYRPPDPHRKLVGSKCISHGQKHTHVHVTVGQLSLLTHYAQVKKADIRDFFFLPTLASVFI